MEALTTNNTYYSDGRLLDSRSDRPVFQFLDKVDKFEKMRLNIDGTICRISMYGDKRDSSWIEQLKRLRALVNTFQKFDTKFKEYGDLVIHLYNCNQLDCSLEITNYKTYNITFTIYDNKSSELRLDNEVIDDGKLQMFLADIVVLAKINEKYCK